MATGLITTTHIIKNQSKKEHKKLQDHSIFRMICRTGTGARDVDFRIRKQNKVDLKSRQCETRIKLSLKIYHSKKCNWIPAKPCLFQNSIRTLNKYSSMETIVQPKWYAVYTRPRWEKKVAEIMTDKKIENYCPLNKVVRQWSDRKKIVCEPLFTSYVFVRTTEKQLYEARKISGIINVVYWLSKPAVIRDEEIECIKNFLSDYKNVKLEKCSVNINDTVRVTKGPLMEYEGNVIAVKSATIKISLPSLGYMMIAEVEKANVEVVKSNSSVKEHTSLKGETSI